MNDAKMLKFFTENASLLSRIVTEDFVKFPKDFFGNVLQFIANLEMKEEDARNHVKLIIENRSKMSLALGRPVDLRVAAMDYFTEETRILENPQIIDCSVLEGIRKRSTEDSKTGCYNSDFLVEFTKKEITRAKRYNHQLSLIIVDLDNFKTINDQLGHLFGDQVLKDFADTIKNHIRSEDFLFRFGGDEFVIVLPQTGRTGARCLAEKLSIQIRELFTGAFYHESKLKFGFSAGIATYPTDGESYEKLLSSADVSLYQAKLLGKNRIFDFFDKDTPTRGEYECREIQLSDFFNSSMPGLEHHQLSKSVS